MHSLARNKVEGERWRVQGLLDIKLRALVYRGAMNIAANKGHNNKNNQVEEPWYKKHILFCLKQTKHHGCTMYKYCLRFVILM